MIEITNVRNGAILNHHHGVETDKALTIKIEGISQDGRPVKINGQPAEMDGRYFQTKIDLTQKINPVTASVKTPYGTFSQNVELVWDKKSFRRGNFYIDDHSFLFTDLAKERPKSCFDHFYLKALKKIHQDYGMKVTLNTFYHNDHHDFELKDMPDIWKSEFQDNSDWLKFSFHSYGEFPDRPYLESTAEEFGRDWDLVQGEIVRFAGEESFIPPIVAHWGNIHPAVGLEMIRRGTRCYSYAMRPRVMGGPSLADRQKGGNMTTVQQRSLSGDDLDRGSEGMALHYDVPEEASYLKNHSAYYDTELGICFYKRCFVCCNLIPLKEIAGRFEEEQKRAERVGDDIFGAASHEQYSFPYYPNYLPDHLDRLREAARCMYEVGGCKPVFFNDGLMGNTSWE